MIIFKQFVSLHPWKKNNWSVAAAAAAAAFITTTTTHHFYNSWFYSFLVVPD